MTPNVEAPLWPRRVVRVAQELNQVAAQCRTMVSFTLLPDWLLVQVQNGADIWVSREGIAEYDSGTVRCVVGPGYYDCWRVGGHTKWKDLRAIVKASLKAGEQRGARHAVDRVGGAPKV
jgi:hypothetical protein